MRKTGRASDRGYANYISGQMAEDQVAQKYIRNGFDIIARRFRRREGEIDLIARHKDRYYFVEVKKSRSFEAAAAQIGQRQISRIRNAALRFLADMDLSMNCDMRFDAALVDQRGAIKVIPAAF